MKYFAALAASWLLLAHGHGISVEFLELRQLVCRVVFINGDVPGIDVYQIILTHYSVLLATDITIANAC